MSINVCAMRRTWWWMWWRMVTRTPGSGSSPSSVMNE